MAAILFVGDIHLGRRPGRIEPALQALGLSSRDVSAAAAWGALVDHAVESRAAAVVLAGDVVDLPQDRFEAYGVLETGIRRLVDAGVAVLGVAGNHDGLVLPRLADRLQDFRLLGRSGTWERAELETGGAPVDVVGWSFPHASFSSNPLLEPSFETAVAGRRPEATLVGVLHADLDVAASSYAPVPRRALEESDPDAWLLGHIHAPEDLSRRRPIGYLGSLVGLDPGEPGLHGAWEISVDGGIRLRQIPLAPIRWERLDVSLDDVGRGNGALDADAVQQAVVDAVRARMDDGSFSSTWLRVTAWRLRLTGQVDAAGRRAVRELMGRWSGEEAVLDEGDRPWFVEGMHDATSPAVDLDALSNLRTPLGHVARRLQELKARGAEDLVRRAEPLVTDFERKGWKVDEHPLPDLREALRDATRRALDALLEQVEGNTAREDG